MGCLNLDSEPIGENVGEGVWMKSGVDFNSLVSRDSRQNLKHALLKTPWVVVLIALPDFLSQLLGGYV